MRGEIDDEQPAARRQQARRLSDRRCRIVEEVQHLMQRHGVGRAVGQREGLEIAVPHLDMP